MIHLHVLSDYYRSYESGFIDLLNVQHNYLHCPNLCHFNSIGVRGESIITYLQIHGSSGFGHLTIDSAVAPHDKTDVSRQLNKQQFNLV